MPAPTTSGAIFLSYAREDTGAARRLAGALRGFGMDVWFDQHELRGGDAWDAKIRGQIRDCTLFMARGLRLWAEAVDLNDRLVKQGPSWRAYVSRAITEYELTTDSQKVSHWLEMIPEMKRDEPRAAVMRFRVALLRRDAVQAQRALGVVSTDYIEDTLYTGPRALLLAQAREISDHRESAVNQWRLAEEACRARLKTLPENATARAMLAIAVAGQKRLAEARELSDSVTPSRFTTAHLAHAFVLIGDHAQAIARLREVTSVQVTARHYERNHAGILCGSVRTILRCSRRWPRRTHPRGPGESIRKHHARLNAHVMKRPPYFFPLQGDLRFQALLIDPKNNTSRFG